MPVKIQDNLPAIDILAKENIFVMTTSRAAQQDIRPLHIAVLNLMPTKVVTETQLLRVIGNTPLQVEVTLLRTATHLSRHTPLEHLETFYKTFDEIQDTSFDGLIITGAPVEQLEYESVFYWQELTAIMDWAQKHVFSTMYICWAAQAGLFYRYGVDKHPLPSKDATASLPTGCSTDKPLWCAALTMCSTPPIPGTPRCGWRTLSRCRSWRCSPAPTRRALT